MARFPTPVALRLVMGGLVLAGATSLTTCRLDKLISPPSGGILTVSPTRLVDTAAVGSAASRSLSLEISNAVPGRLSWTAARLLSSSWLALDAASGTAPSTLRLTADPAGLAVGTYRDTVVVTTNGTSEGEARIPIEFTIRSCLVTPIPLDAQLGGAIGRADCTAPHRDTTFAELYSFTGSAGDSVSIELVSSEFAPHLIFDTAGAATAPPLAQTAACAGVPGAPCLRYQRLPRSGTFWIEATSVAAGDTGAYTLGLYRPRAPNLPQSLAQFGGDSTTAIPTGGSSGSTIVVGGVVPDPDGGDSLRLEVEVRPVGTTFTGAATATGALVRNGVRAFARVTGLADNVGYHWRARAVDQTGRVGAWMAFGGNAETDPDLSVAVAEPPAAPATPGQLKADGLTAIAVGGTTDEQTVSFKATVSDPDPGDRLRLHVEVRPIGTAFSNAPTDSSAQVASGAIATTTVTALTNKTNYHWQARVSDESGRTGPWLAFGGNAESATDFRVEILGAPSAPTALGQFKSDATTAIATGGTTDQTTVVFKGTVTDPDAGEQLRLEVEHQPIGTAFSNAPTGTSVQVANGAVAVVTVPGLADNVAYHWQARTMDQTGRAGPWAAFGGNDEGAIDFRVVLPPNRLAFTVQPVNTAAGATIVPAVRIAAQDQAGATLTSFTGDVTLAIGTNAGGGTLAGTLTRPAILGVATFADLSINKTGTGYTLVAAATGMGGATSTAFNITPGPAAKLAITTQPSSSVPSGTVFPQQPVIQLQDANGNAVPQSGTGVTALIASGGGALGGTPTVPTNAGGAAPFTNLMITGTAGARTLRFRTTGLDSVTSNAVTVTAGAATQIAVNGGNSQAATAGTAVAVVPSVIVRDASNNPVQGVPVTFAVTPSNGGITGATSTTNASGIAQVGSWTLSTVAKLDTLTATATGLTGSPVTFVDTAKVGPPAVMTKSSGDNLTGQVGTALATPHEVRITDVHGNPALGAAVSWAAATGGGSVNPTVSTTNADGRATTIRTLGPTAGTHTTTATATLTGGPTTVTFSANATVGGATQMTITGGQNQVDTVGQTLPTPLTVRVADNLSNPVPGVPISWAVTNGGGSLSQALDTTDANGLSSVTWTLGTLMSPTDSTQQVQATGVGSPLAFTAFTVPGPVSPTQTTVTAAPATITAGGAASTITVTARDQFGNVIKGKAVTLAATGSGNTLTQLSTPTDVNGVATGTLSSTKAEAKSVSATVGGVAITQPATVTVNPAAVSAGLSTLSATSPIIAGSGTSTITVTARDAFSNPIPLATVVLAATGPGNTLTQPDSATNASGVATGTLSSTAAGNKVVSATIDTVPITQTDTVVVTAGLATKLFITTEPSATAQSGVAFAPQPAVRLRDAGDNNVSQAGVVITATVATGPGGATLVNATATTAANGLATFSGLAISGPTGSYRLQMAAGVLTPDTTTAITLNPGPAAKLALPTQPSTSVQNAIAFPQQPVVQLQDAAGNNVSLAGVAVTPAIATGGGTLSPLTAVSTNASGAAAFTGLTITGTVGVRTLSFTSGTLTGVASGPVTVTAGTATQIAVNAGNGQSAAAGTAVAIAPSVIVRDVSGNPVSLVSVTFATDPGNGTVNPVTPILTNASGIAAVTSWTLGINAGTDTLTATPSPVLTGSPVRFTATATVGLPATMEKSSGDNVTGQVGTTLGTPHEVTVRDANGNPVANVPITWAAATGGGSVNPTGSTTDINGKATTTRTLGLTPGTQTTTATANLTGGGGSTTVTFNVNATVGGATQMTITGGQNQTDTVGQTLPTPLSVRVADQFNNPVQGVQISWSVIDGGGSVNPGASTTDASGIATTSWTLGTTTTPTDTIQSVQATGVASPLTFTAYTVPGPVSAAQTIVVATSPITASSGGSASTITVTARDPFGNVIKGKTVTLVATGTNNTLTQPAAPTNANGVATGTLSSTKAEAKTLSATVAEVAITQQPTVTVNPAGATTLVFWTQPSNVAAGASITPAVQVEIRDPFANRVTSATNGVGLTLDANPGGGALTGGGTVAAVGGVATFAGLSIDKTGTGYTLTAASTGLTGAPSTGFNVAAGAVSPSQSTLSATSPITAGSGTSTITVTARDGLGNPIAGATVLLAATGAGNTLAQPGPTNASGVATGTLTSTVAEGKTISATINGTGITPTAAVTVSPAAVSAAQSTVTAAPGSIEAGGVSTITVTARDAFGNPIPGATVVLAATGTANSLTQPGPTSSVGAATGTLSSTVAETKTVSATVNGTAIAQTAAVIVTPTGVDAALSTVTAAPPTIAASGGTSQSTITVTAKDGFGNPIAGATVVLAASGGGNTLSAPGPTGATGVTTATLSSTVAEGKTISATINGTAITQTTTVTVQPAVPSGAQTLVTAAPGTITASGGSSQATITVTVRDAFGNAIQGASVTLAATGAGNTLTQPATLTNASGVTTGTLSSVTAGTKTVSATVNGSIAVAQTATVNVLAATAAELVFTVQPTNTVAGAAITPAVQVVARDEFGNTATGFGGSVTMALAANPAGGTLAGTTTVPAGSGVATFSDLRIQKAGTGYALSASAGGATADTSVAFNVLVGGVSAAQSTVTAAPGTIPASSGSSQSIITVTARDSVGNPIAGAAVLLTSTGSGTTLTQPGPTDATGVATGTLSSTVAQAKIVSATIGGVAITQTATVTVTPAAVSAAASTVIASPTAITASSGASVATITVTVKDQFGNAIAGATVALAATGTANALTQPAGPTNASGVATGTLSSTKAEAKTVSATVNGAVTITQTATVTVSPESPSQVGFVVQPAGAAAGATITPAVQVGIEDQFGNVVSSGPQRTIALSISTNPGGGVLSGTTSVQVAGGSSPRIAVFSDLSINKVGVGYRLQAVATAGSLTPDTSTTFDISAGAVSAALSTVAAAPTTITVGSGASTITVTAKDALGNAIPGASVVLAATGTGNTLTQPAGPTDASGVATGSLSSGVAGTKTVSATINGVAITQTALVTVTAAPTTTTITGDAPDPSVVGEAVTVTFTVTSTGGTPTGNVTVSDGAANCVGTVAAGTCALTPTTAGAKTLTATYAGDGNFTGSASAGVGHTVNPAATTTTITGGSPNPSAVGQAVSFTYAVVANAPGSGTPTGGGTVNVSDGVQSCNATVAAGGCSIAFSSAGGRTVTATYAGDGNFAASTSAGVTHTVGAAGTTTTITADTPDPSVVGQVVPVTFTVTSTGGTPTGNVTVSDGALTCVGTVAAGGCALTSTTAGPKTLTATYAGDANFAGSSSPDVAHAVNQAGTTTAITADTPDPSVVGQAYTVSYSVAVSAPGSGTPTGNITVSDGTQSCIGTVAAGSCALASTTAGGKTLTATYAGDANFTGSASAGVGHTVNPATTTTAITTHTPDPSAVGQAVSFTSTVVANAPGSGTPTGGGTVTVSDGVQSCNATVAAGGCSIAFTSTGGRTVTATYAGDANFAGSTSAGVTHTVGAAATTTSITGDAPDPSVVGQAVTVSFTVTSSGGTPTGTVTVSDGTVNCVGTVAAGSCALASTTAGPKTLTATYAGDGNFAGSASAGVAHTVDPAATTTTITTDTPDPSVVGQAVSFTYTVVANAPGGGSPIGSVTVSDGVQSCNATVAAGGCSIAFTSAGGRSVTATYAGDANFTTSASAGVAHTVNAAGTTTAITGVTPDPSAVGQAYTVSYSVAVSAPGSGTPTGTVTVSDGIVSCIATVAAGSCALASTTAGGKTLTATYAGDGNFAGSASTGVAHTVNAAATTTSITGDTPDPSVVGQAVSFTYSVVANAPGSGTPTGTVTVSDGIQSCNATVAAGGCSIAFSSTGGRTVTATYTSDGNFTGSASASVGHTVNQAGTTTAITGDTPDPSVVGQAYTVSYSVAVSAPGDGTPTGNVTVSDGTLSCIGTVAAGSCSLTSLTPGAKTLTATYAGDANFAASTSAGAPHQVNAFGEASATQSTLTTSVSTITASAGSSAATITVTARDQFGNSIESATVVLSATGTNNNITPPGATNGSGVTSGTLSSTKAEDKIISATINGVAITQTDTITVTAGAVSASLSTVSASPTTIPAVTGTSTITVTAKDAFGNAIVGAAVVLNATGVGNTLTQSSGPTDGSGVATGTLSSLVAEPKTISATIDGTAITQTADVEVTLVTGASGASAADPAAVFVGDEIARELAAGAGRLSILSHSALTILL
ncbi:MAG: Ig-like domain-containing protein [Gemmatimonadales bacterium]